MAARRQTPHPGVLTGCFMTHACLRRHISFKIRPKYPDILGEVMSTSKKLSFDLHDLPVDVFDVADAGLRVETLTAGHGMPELGGSNYCSCSSCPCVCSTVQASHFPEESPRVVK
jgi:hypothetical protein